MLISMREFARRNGVSPEAISRAVKSGRLLSVNGKIDPDQAQAVWDTVKSLSQAGRKHKRRGCQSSKIDTAGECQSSGLGCQSSRAEVEVGGLAMDVQPAGPAWAEKFSVVNPAEIDKSPAVNLAKFPTQAGELHGQVYSASGMPLHPEPPTNGRDRIAITTWINGSEELELDKKRAGTGLSLPSYVVTTCGYEQWRLDAARGRGERPSRRRPVRHALERRSVTIILSREDFEDLWWRSAPSGLTLPQFIRTLLGFQVRNDANPDVFARTRESDEAWERLQRLGLEPAEYFED